MGRYNKPVALAIGQKVSYGIGATIGTIVKRQGNDYLVQFDDCTKWCGKNVLQPEISEEEIAAICAEIQKTWSPNQRHEKTAGAYQRKEVDVHYVRDSQI